MNAITKVYKGTILKKQGSLSALDLAGHCHAVSTTAVPDPTS